MILMGLTHYIPGPLFTKKILSGWYRIYIINLGSALAIMPSHQQNRHDFADGRKNMNGIFNNYVCSASHMRPGGRLNKKDGLTRYGDSHVKDKTSLRPSYL